MHPFKIPFSRPYLSGNEYRYIEAAVQSGRISGGGPFGKRCEMLLSKLIGSSDVLLTSSCTSALEIAAFLLDALPGDEVILPSFTYVSTANAFVIRGMKPVFIDIHPDTLNLDERLLESLITSKTRAIVPVHYAGVACQMDEIGQISSKYKLTLIEDAAHALGGTFSGRPLGTFGAIGVYSFHETKNLSCGEGGAMVINEARLLERAEILREKGTNRTQFIQGLMHQYTWMDYGSSYALSDLQAAYLLAQLESFEEIQRKRAQIWNDYYQELRFLEQAGHLTLPKSIPQAFSSYHLFYVLLPNKEERDSLMHWLQSHGILAVFHYIPLHNSPMGSRYHDSIRDLPVTRSVSERILRLPFYTGLSRRDQSEVIERLYEYFQ